MQKTILKISNMLALLYFLLLLGVEGRCSGWGSGAPCTLECLPIAIMLYHEALLFPTLKLEKHVLLSDTETDFSPSDIDPCLGGP